jgi:hypothetical protein
MDQMFKLSGKGEPSLPPALPTPCGPNSKVDRLRPLAMSVARSSTDHDAGDAADLISTL